MLDVDVLVLGGGLAGLSLAERLAGERVAGPRVVVVEPRTEYRDDRTWCAWRVAPHRYEGLVERSWSRFEVRHGGRSVTVACPDAPYQMIASRAFYGRAQDALEPSDRVRLELGRSAVGAPVRGDHGWTVSLDDGRAVRARHVVDTRPPPAPPASILWQSFLGDVVEVDAEVFDPKTAILMDFADCSDDGVQFVYVLPLSAREALVETTVFGPRRLGPADLLERQQEALLARTGGRTFTVARTEHGVLPMGHARPTTPPGLVCASLFHGGARASTGYAFTRIQSWADACAASLAAGGPPVAPRPDPWLRRAMDEVFLRVLRAHPARGGEMLQRLFERADPARVIRFLSDRSGLADALGVVRALPPAPFLAQSVCAALRTRCRGSA